MGGSGVNPSTDRPDKKSKDKLKKRRQEFALYIQAYIDRVGDCLRAWGRTEYGRLEAIRWLKLIQKKLTEGEDLENKLKTGESWLIVMNLTRRVRGLLETKSYIKAEEHFEMLERVAKGTIKRMEDVFSRRNGR